LNYMQSAILSFFVLSCFKQNPGIKQEQIA
jgi:hypothetical protein